MNIVDFIPKGKENAVSKYTLATTLEISEREVRRQIEEQRNKGVPIISCSHSKGYYIADSREDVEIITRDLRSRAFKMLKTVSAFENHCEGQCEGQIGFNYD